MILRIALTDSFEMLCQDLWERSIHPDGGFEGVTPYERGQLLDRPVAIEYFYSRLDSREGPMAAQILEVITAVQNEQLRASVIEQLEADQQSDLTAPLILLLRKHGNSSDITLLRKFAVSNRDDIRDATAAAVSWLGCESRDVVAAEMLVSLSGDPDPEVRFSAVWEIGWWWDDGARNASLERVLRQSIEDSDSRIQRIGIESIGDL